MLDLNKTRSDLHFNRAFFKRCLDLKLKYSSTVSIKRFLLPKIKLFLFGNICYVFWLHVCDNAQTVPSG